MCQMLVISGLLGGNRSTSIRTTLTAYHGSSFTRDRLKFLNATQKGLKKVVEEMGPKVIAFDDTGKKQMQKLINKINAEKVTLIYVGKDDVSPHINQKLQFDDWDKVNVNPYLTETN